MTQSAVLGDVNSAAGSVVRGNFNTGSQAVLTESQGTSAPTKTYPFMLWRNDTDKLLRSRNSGNSSWEIVRNYGSTTNPTVNVDETDGYKFGSEYYNLTAKEIFACIDPTDGAADWRSISTTSNYYINVKEFGAKGNGVTDDTAAIQSALDAGAAVNGIVYFPRGRYILSATLTVANASIQIMGAGQSVTELRWTSHSVGIYITSNNAQQYHKICDLTLSTYYSDGTGLFLNYSGQIVDVGGGNLNTMDRLHTRFIVDSVTICGSNLIDNGIPSNGFINGIYVQAALYGTIRDATIVGKSAGDLVGTTNTAGVVFAGNPTAGNFQNGHPVCLSLIGCFIAYYDRGYFVLNAEGVFINRTTILHCNIGINVISEVNAHPHLTINRNTITSAIRCISIQGQIENHIYQNNLLINEYGAGAVAVEVSAGSYSTNFTKNIITCLGTGQYGLLVSGTKGVVSGNIYKGNMIYSIWLATTSNGFKGKNNILLGTGTLLNQGTGNTVS